MSIEHLPELELEHTPPAESGVREVLARPDQHDDTGAEVTAYALFMEHAYVTGVSTLPLIMSIALGVGSAMVLQTTMAPTPPSTELGRMLVVVVMRELAPLLTAVVIAGQWGRALSMDLRSGRPLDMASWPRITGTAVACAALAVHFAVTGMFGAYVTSQALTIRTFDAVREGFHMELAWFDLPLFMAKTGGLGAIVAWLGSREASQVSTPESVAEAASRVFVRALVIGGVFSIGLTMVLYAIVGAPLPP